MKYILSFIIVLFCSCSNSINAEAPRVITLFNQEKDAGKGYFWSEPFHCKNQDICYILKNEGNLEAWSVSSLVKITPQTTKDIFKNKGSQERYITKIYKVSDDGKYLLVDVGYLSKKEGYTKIFKYKPMILDANTSELIEIDPQP